MLKKSEVLSILENGGHITICEIYRSANVYAADGAHVDTCRIDTAEKIGRLEGFQDIRVGTGWNFTRKISKAAQEAQEEAAAQDQPEAQEETEPAQEAAQEAQEEPKHRVHNVVTDEVLEGTTRALYYALQFRVRFDAYQEEPAAVWEPCDDGARRILEAVAAATGRRVKIAAVRVDDLLEDLSTGDYGEYLNDYRDSSAYICDAISEIADNHTSIYYYQIIKFISENVEAVNDAIAEYGWDGCGGDLYKAGQMAEYNAIQADIWENQADALMMAALNFIKWDMKINIIPADLADDIRDWCDDADTDDRMSDIPDKIRDYFQEEE